MPLVSGVRRTASAPMLPHGGSRLNASKPEASPKTRCPKHYFLIFTIISHSALCGKYVSHGLLHEGGPTQKITRNTTIESPFKQLQPAAASKAQSKTYDHKTCFHKSRGHWTRIAPQTCAAGRGPGTTQQKTHTTSLSKRENMHGLA